MGYFQHSKWSDGKRCSVKVRWGISLRIWLYFFISKSGCKYSHSNSYNFARWSSYRWSLGRLWFACSQQCVAMWYPSTWWSPVKSLFVHLNQGVPRQETDDFARFNLRAVYTCRGDFNVYREVRQLTDKSFHNWLRFLVTHNVKYHKFFQMRVYIRA